MNAAELVISKFGGVAQLAEKVGRSRSRVWRWTQPRSKYGTNGKIPTSMIPTVLEAAKAEGIKLTEKEILFGDE